MSIILLGLILFARRIDQCKPIRVVALIALLLWSLMAMPCPAATILIDPGHGGIDHGAVGAQNYYEKTFSLELAQNVAKLLSPDHQVQMTRDADVGLSIPDRAGMANHIAADLMVSVHAAVPPYGDDKKAAVFYYDDGRIVLPQDVSAKGNAGTDRFSWCNLQAAHQGQSRALAALIGQSLHDEGGYETTILGGAPLAILMGADCPAILLEIGCIRPSSRGEGAKAEQLMQHHAQAIARAISLALSPQPADDKSAP